VSVFKRNYRPFQGKPTSRASRFKVLMRYSFSDIWSSRITVVLFLLCMLPTFLSTAMIYIVNNAAVRMLIGNATGSGIASVVIINERYFFVIMQGQCWLALVLTAWIGPRVIALDLSNNALPTILSHPVSRLEYVMAKFSVLAAFLSAVTWVPMVLLFALQSYLSATPWASNHLQIAFGAFVGSAIWIVLLSLVALAVSSWVRWRIVATAMIFAALFVPAGMGGVFNAVLRTNWGNLVNIPVVMYTLWERLLNVELPRYGPRDELPTIAILMALAAMCTICAVALNARIRAREVVRG
jgi:ABC-type transport system involved in multi-copper enzyme maturation permease subunit